MIGKIGVFLRFMDAIAPIATALTESLCIVNVVSDITMQFESNNKGPAMNCKKFIQLPTYCFDQAICNLLWLQNHELKSQKERPKTKISMKLHISISLALTKEDNIE